jgi:hypothetical protein
MGQLIITGPDRLKLLQRTTVGNTLRKNLLIVGGQKNAMS